ncbi:MAG: redoxin domain-containing protein [Deltaproteobacteria bacterium]|nr:MAG: redoxin domain-containing protein [Deltaproteobacteria bacterium]
MVGMRIVAFHNVDGILCLGVQHGMEVFAVIVLRGLFVMMFVSFAALGGCSGPTGSTNNNADGGATADQSGGTQCIGVDPKTEEAWSPESPKECEGKPNTCIGAPMPDWKLKDFQPQSCGFGQTYGLRAFRGKVTVLVLLAAWCGFCQAQLEKLERMRLELAANGKDVHFLVVNQDNAANDQQQFVSRSGIPLFQDTTEAQVWAKQGGGKDDMFIYNSKGYLVKYWPFNGDVDINLSGEGYNNLKSAIEKAE